VVSDWNLFMLKVLWELTIQENRLKKHVKYVYSATLAFNPNINSEQNLYLTFTFESFEKNQAEMSEKRYKPEEN